MTIQEAYASGFCKVAKANGVDPTELIKLARTFGGPPPAHGMLGASMPKSKEKGVLKRLYDSMPAGVFPTFAIGKGGIKMVTKGDIDKMTAGMSPMQRALAHLNPTMLNFRKAAEAHGVDPQELMKAALAVKLTRGQEKAIDYILKNIRPNGRGGFGILMPKNPVPPKGGSWADVKRVRRGFSGADVDFGIDFLGLNRVNPADVVSSGRGGFGIRIPKKPAPPKRK